MIPWFQFTTVHLGPVPIQVWGFFVAVGMLVGSYILYKKSLAAFGKKDAEKIMDVALSAIISGLIVSRLFHIVFYNPLPFLADPMEVFRVWHGGFSSYGGFVGALLAIVWFYKKKGFPKKENLLKVLDYFAMGTLAGWMFGRVGCFMIHDHMGMPCDCALAIQTPDGPRLEMAFLELLCLIPLVITFWFFSKKNMPEGFFIGLLGAYYGAVRFVLDFFRATDITGADARYFGLTPAQYFSMIVLLLCSRFLYKLYRRSRASG